MNIRPLGRTILAQEMPREERSKGGIYIPEETREMQQFNHKVIAVGPEVRDIKVGDIVYVPAQAKRRTIDYKGERCFRFMEEEIPCIIEG